MSGLRIIAFATASLAVLALGCSSPATHAHDAAPYLASGDAGGGGDRDVWQHQAALDKGIEYLLSTQKADGSFGHFLPRRPADIYLGTLESLHAFGNASTALVASSLLLQEANPRINAAIKRTFSYLTAHAPVNKRVNHDTFYNVWSHTFMVDAFIDGLADPRLADMKAAITARCQDEVDRLLRLQALDGGYGYFDFDHHLDPPSGGQSTSFNTGAALLALLRAKDAGFRVPDHAMRRGHASLKRMALPDGAYIYSFSHLNAGPLGRSNKIEGSLTRSPCCNLALFRLNDDWMNATRLKKGVQNLLDHHEYVEIARQRQYPHETWFANAPYYYYFGHYYAALNFAHLDSDASMAQADALAAFVAKTPDTDGSFWDYPLYGYTKAYGTALATLCLSHCKRVWLTGQGPNEGVAR